MIPIPLAIPILLRRTILLMIRMALGYCLRPMQHLQRLAMYPVLCKRYPRPGPQQVLPEEPPPITS